MKKGDVGILLDKAIQGAPEHQLLQSYSLFQLFQFFTKDWLKSKKKLHKLLKATQAVGKACSRKTTSEEKQWR